MRKTVFAACLVLVAAALSARVFASEGELPAAPASHGAEAHNLDTLSQTPESATEDTNSAAPVIRHGHKYPLLAAGLSLLLPGAGQFYNGHYKKGCAIIGASTVVVGATFTYIAVTGGDIGSWDTRPLCHMAAPCVGAIAVWSAIDAAVSADRSNQTTGRAGLRPRLKPDGLGLVPTAGLELTVKF